MPLRTGVVCFALIASVGAPAGPYGEVGGGAYLVDELSASSLTLPQLGGADFAYELKLGMAVEGGVRGIRDTPFGIGFGLQGFRSALDEVVVGEAAPLVGADIPGGVAAEGLALSAEDVAAQGFNFDDRVTIVSTNGYYDFGDEEGLVIFVGVGYGIAAISDDLKGGLLVHLGARLPLKPIGYLSLRATRFQSDGQEDRDNNLEFDAFGVNAVTLSLRLDF